jgi:myosin heavy subunit
MFGLWCPRPSTSSPLAINAQANYEFVIIHYAGDVCYSTAGLLEKNKVGVGTMWWD